MKICKRCGLNKSLDDFYRHVGFCKPCHAIRNREWRENNKDRLRAFRRQYDRDNRDHINAQKRSLSARNKNRQRNWQLKHQYGISLNEFNAMLLSQGDCCLICGRHKTERRMVVDHSHQSGAIRGILCHICNSVLGLVSERQDVLEKMKTYLTDNTILSVSGGSNA